LKLRTSLYIIAMDTLIACLYFIPGGKPVDADKDAATRFSTRTGKKVVFRDSNKEPGETLEPCEGWLGEAPQAYRDAFPDASTLPDAPEPPQAAEEAGKALPETAPEETPAEEGSGRRRRP
jgi:hypothetical protein